MSLFKLAIVAFSILGHTDKVLRNGQNILVEAVPAKITVGIIIAHETCKWCIRIISLISFFVNKKVRVIFIRITVTCLAYCQ